MTGLHLTLREILSGIWNRKTAAIWLALTIFAAMAGPFGSDDAPLEIRAPYWAVSIAIAMTLSTPIITWAYRGPIGARVPGWAAAIIGALIFSVIYTGLLGFLTAAIFGTMGGYPDFLELFCYVAALAVIIALLIDFFVFESGGDAPPGERFFKRLKPALGRDLVRLSMQDHYLEVVTKAGSDLILLRFSDALEEVADLPGWRIHRSHWVAEDGIADVKRADGKTMVQTLDGAELPVSRTYLPVLRDAGVLKRFG
ncbi:MAG: LytTR family DNA-binding domain-containing protein [Pseudomonadota bacterium]